MHLATLHLENVRNIESLDVAFDPGFNYIHGENGAGKTAILEAIHVLARGRSFRSAKTDSLIRNEASELLIRAELEGLDVRRNAGYLKSRATPPQLRLDGQNQQKASSLAKEIPVQTLLPAAADLIFGAPSERRGFVDWGLFHVEPGFLRDSNDYRRVLAQRNAWLKQINDADDDIASDPWLPNLAALAQSISEHRAGYLDALTPHLGALLEQLSPLMRVSLTYDWGGLVDAESCVKKMSESWPRDVKFGLTHRGPHRADIAVDCATGAAAETLSRGQAKLVASAANLAQVALLQERMGLSSLVLIDDFGAELDSRHWRQFVRTLAGMQCQVIATSTERWDGTAEWIDDLQSYAVFHVEHGTLRTE